MKKTFIVIGSVIAGLVVAYLIIANVSQRMAKYQETDVVAIDSSEFKAPPPPKIMYGINVDSMTVEERVIKRNENLSEILSKYNISPQTIFEISKLPRDTFNVRRLQSRKPYTIIHENDSLKTARAFIYHPNRIDFTMLIFDDSVIVYNGKNKVDTIVEVATGVI